MAELWRNPLHRSLAKTRFPRKPARRTRARCAHDPILKRLRRFSHIDPPF